MANPECQTCGLRFRFATMFWRGGQLFWSHRPGDRAHFEATCEHARKGFGDSIVWCPAMRAAFETGPMQTPVASLSNREVMERFVSLGDNCELGLAQRWASSEPIDLLRFTVFEVAAEDILPCTTVAVDQGFDGLGDPGTVTCELGSGGARREYFIYDTKWRLRTHTYIYEGEIEQETLHKAEMKLLQLKRRKILKELASGDRTFVWKSNVPSPEAQVRALLTSLRRHGSNRLLWVLAADAAHPAGLVEDAGGGLMKGYVSRFAPYEDATAIDPDSWHAMCRNALLLASAQVVQSDVQRGGAVGQPAGRQ